MVVFAPAFPATAWPSAELRFPAMGSDAHVVVVGPGADARMRSARLAIERFEAAWSRFLPDSEISRLNRQAGQTVPVGSETLQLVTLAEYAHIATDGRFDATLGNELTELGYDRSFESLGDAPARRTADPGRCRPRGHQRPRVDGERGTVQLPAGTAFDPGGIGKGLAADLVTRQLIADGAWGALVSLGGDLRVAGTPPAGETWIVAVVHPDAGPVSSLALTEGGLATSSTRRRRWTAERSEKAGTERHHLLDPTTGQPHVGGAEHVTVVAGAAWWAEVVATSLIGGGADVDPPNDCAALLALRGPDGRTVHGRLGGFERYEVASQQRQGSPS